MRMQSVADYGNGFENSSSPERQLWCAVVDRALQDAMDRIATVSGVTERQRIRQDARDWFLRNDDDFRIACEAAGYDPDHLRSRILRMIEAGAVVR